jgi:hypothetical protein
MSQEKRVKKSAWVKVGEGDGGATMPGIVLLDPPLPTALVWRSLPDIGPRFWCVSVVCGDLKRGVVAGAGG